MLYPKKQTKLTRQINEIESLPGLETPGWLFMEKYAQLTINPAILILFEPSINVILNKYQAKN